MNHNPFINNVNNDYQEEQSDYKNFMTPQNVREFNSYDRDLIRGINLIQHEILRDIVKEYFKILSHYYSSNSVMLYQNNRYVNKFCLFLLAIYFHFYNKLITYNNKAS